MAPLLLQRVICLRTFLEVHAEAQLTCPFALGNSLLLVIWVLLVHARIAVFATSSPIWGATVVARLAELVIA